MDNLPQLTDEIEILIIQKKNLLRSIAHLYSIINLLRKKEMSDEDFYNKGMAILAFLFDTVPETSQYIGLKKKDREQIQDRIKMNKEKTKGDKQ